MYMYMRVCVRIHTYIQELIIQLNSNLLLTHKRSCQTYESYMYITAMHIAITCKMRDTLKNDKITAMQNIQPLFAG